MSAADAAGARIVLITHPEEGAQGFARDLVERRLAACVNLVPVESVYRWQGAVEAGGERMLVVKTRLARVLELERFVAAEHPYDIPEFVVLAPEHVGADYLRWVLAETDAD